MYEIFSDVFPSNQNSGVHNILCILLSASFEYIYICGISSILFLCLLYLNLFIPHPPQANELWSPLQLVTSAVRLFSALSSLALNCVSYSFYVRIRARLERPAVASATYSSAAPVDSVDATAAHSTRIVKRRESRSPQRLLPRPPRRASQAMHATRVSPQR